QTAQPISTAVPGLQICEDLPKLAARAEQPCVISSMTHDVVNHMTAPHWLLTACKSPGDTGLPLDRDSPSIGSGLNQQGLAVVPRDASGQISGWTARATSICVHLWFKITPDIPLRLSVNIRVHP
ncbi:MAG: DUF1501 domain-containing protein, partial [Planctomyces sp.]